jgi:prefoldin subunit 5
MNAMVREIYDRTDQELAEKEARLDLLQARLDSLTRKVEALSAPAEEKEGPAI